MGTDAETLPRRRARADGVRSRAAILAGAARLATVEGLDGLSIGGLSDEIGMSKSGLYAHFGSKLDLQLATVDYAEEVFDREVVGPGLDHAPGLPRVRGVCEAFFRYLEDDVFPGGCFFASAAAELGPRKGPVRDRIREFAIRFVGLLEAELEMARTGGDLAAAAEPAQLAFELDALMLGANSAYILFGDPAAIERARAGVERLLDAATP